MSEPMVYALVDQRSGQPFYIGMVESDPLRRYLEHLNCSGDNLALNARIGECTAAGFIPPMMKLEQCPSKQLARLREAYWIHHYLGLGVPLLNRSIPKPIHLRDRKEREQALARVQFTTEPENRAHTVHAMLRQGFHKRDIIAHLWHARAGGNAAYEKASAEYDHIVSTLDDVPPGQSKVS